MHKRYDIIIVGGGAVGCAIAYSLARFDISIALLERNPDVCMGTSGKNSAVVHAGFNNSPGSLMARLCVEGNQGFETLCRTLNVPYRKSGKLVVAFDCEDMNTLNGLMENGRKNGCVGLELLNTDRMKQLIANIGGIGAMYSSNTGVFNPFLYTIHLAESALANGVDFYLSHEVTRISKEDGGFSVSSGGEDFSCNILINSAGLYADQISAMAGDERYHIYPCRGQYFVLDKDASQFAPIPIYPAPHKGVGGLGVHLTTTMDGNVLIGPSAEYVDSKEEYASTPEVLDQLFNEAIQLLPSLNRGMIIGTYTGIRPKLIAKGESNFGDFIIEESKLVPGLIHLIGIESPGLTASMPIARLICKLVREKIPLLEKSDYEPEYRGYPITRYLTPEELHCLVETNPDYGEIVCRCERITKAEILQALDNPLGVRSIIGIKNRVRATMGRCNGGYCFTRIVNMMQDDGLKPEDIIFRDKGDSPFKGKVK
ncbi:MAG: putative dehydrogenase [Evtepia sp.]|jgi:glycerol-3-phosphate dehydrogenase|nr:putative dehydrogenase [Evtepia sp.]